ncbi:MAG: zinc-dependent metalloprotease family protein [Planctomycetota bacterium]|jgi:hypothetical protein
MHRTAVAAVVIALALPASLHAGPASAPGGPPRPAPRAEAALTAAFDVLQARVATLDLPADPARPVVTLLPLEDEWFTLVLEPASVRAAAYRVMVQQDDGALVEVPPRPQRTYRGHVAELPGSAVNATLLDDGLHARIVTGGDEFWVQPSRSRRPAAPAGEHLVFHGEDVIPGDGVCAATAPEGVRIDALVDEPAPAGTAASTTLCVTELAVDVDSDYLALHGSVGAVEDQVNAVINAVNVQFERDVAITHQITTIIVRTAETDPYTTTDPGSLLGDFRTQWEDNHGDVQRDVAHLFTGKELDGSVVGIAYVSVICSSAAYALSQVDCCSTLACAADLVAHELGHNWSASHCDCVGYTMNPSLTCGGQFNETDTVPAIADFRDARTCLDCGVVAPTVCGEPSAGDCLEANGTAGCDDGDCCQTVCAIDTSCCDVAWDQACADLAAALCDLAGPAPQEAAPSNLRVPRGEWLSGTVDDLSASDNARVRVRSAIVGPKERTESRINCVGPLTVSRLDVTVEMGVNVDGVVGLVFLRNFDTDRWDRLDRFVMPASDVVREYLDVASPTSYVNASGKVKLRLLTVHGSARHVARIDHVEVMVTP